MREWIKQTRIKKKKKNELTEFVIIAIIAIIGVFIVLTSLKSFFFLSHRRYCSDDWFSQNATKSKKRERESQTLYYMQAIINQLVWIWNERLTSVWIRWRTKLNETKDKTKQEEKTSLLTTIHPSIIFEYVYRWI